MCSFWNRPGSLVTIANENKRILEILNDSVWNVIGLVVALIVFAIAIHLIRRFFGGGDDLDDSRDQFIREIKELERQGEITEEEFRSIKGQVSAQGVRREAPALPDQSGPVNPAEKS